MAADQVLKRFARQIIKEDAVSQTEPIYLDLIDEMSPGVIKIAGPFLCVLMPMRF